jgi:hypothetical protein
MGQKEKERTDLPSNESFPLLIEPKYAGGYIALALFLTELGLSYSLEEEPANKYITKSGEELLAYTVTCSGTRSYFEQEAGNVRKLIDQARQKNNGRANDQITITLSKSCKNPDGTKGIRSREYTIGKNYVLFNQKAKTPF